MTPQWSLVMPVKPLGMAKSRLASLPAEHREALVVAMASDTVAAALACPRVAGVLVVTDDERVRAAVEALGARVEPDVPRAGLNAALRHGTDVVRSAIAGSRTAVGLLSGDLPALRAKQLLRALDAASAHPRAFVADAAGTGTTLLTGGPGVAPAPAFGPGSCRRHRDSGAAELDLPDIQGLRRDVDTLADLHDALALGVGTRTSAVVESL